MDTAALWQAYAAGDPAAREQLLNRHLGLVHYVARRMQRSLSGEADFDELLSAGTVGLMNALESFDRTRGSAFSTFAAPRIRGAILDELRRLDHVPRSIRRKKREIGAARDALTRTLGRQPHDGETAEHLGVDVETLWRWETEAQSAVQVPLERSPVEHDGRIPRATDPTTADLDSSIEDRVSLGQEIDILRDAITRLKEQERIVLALYYHEELKLHEIAQILALTESRVSQIRSKAISKLRKELGSLREHVA